MPPVDRWCKHHENTVILYFDYILVPFMSLIAFTLIPLTVLYIYAHCQNWTKTRKPLFYVGAVFLIICFLTHIDLIPAHLSHCRHPKNVEIFYNLLTQLYASQTFLLIGLLYQRLWYIFKETTMALKNCTNISFLIFYIINLCALVFGAYSYSNAFVDSSLAVSFAASLSILLIIFLDFLFIYKLYVVNKSATATKNKLSKTITKTSVLAIISTSLTMVFGTATTLEPIIDSIHFSFVVNLLFIADVYSNFLCIWLSYSHFNAYYLKICSCCDSKCKAIWARCLKNNTLELSVTKIEDTQEIDTKTETAVPCSSPSSAV